MDEMDSTDPVHAIPCQSDVDLGDVLDSLLFLKPSGRSQSNSKSPSPTGSSSPPPLPMQPPPSAKAARIFSMMFEPGDTKYPPPPDTSQIIFLPIDIVTSSPIVSPVPARDNKQRGSASSSSSSSSDKSDDDAAEANAEPSPKSPIIADTDTSIPVASSDKEDEQPLSLTISTQVNDENFVPEHFPVSPVDHHTKEDSSDDELAKSPINLQRHKSNSSISSQEAEDVPIESIETTVSSLPLVTLLTGDTDEHKPTELVTPPSSPDIGLRSKIVTYHINDDGFQPGDISVMHENEDSSDDELKSPTRLQRSKSASSDSSNEDDDVSVVLIKPPVVVTDSVHPPTIAMPPYSVDATQLSDDKILPEDLPVIQHEEHSADDEVKSSIRQRSKSASSGSSSEDDTATPVVLAQSPVDVNATIHPLPITTPAPSTEESQFKDENLLPEILAVIQHKEDSSDDDEVKSSIKQRSKSASSDSSSEDDDVPVVLTEPPIDVNASVHSVPISTTVLSIEEYHLNSQTLIPEILPVILHKEDSIDDELKSSIKQQRSKSTSSESSNEDEASIIIPTPSAHVITSPEHKLDSSISSSDTHEVLTNSMKPSSFIAKPESAVDATKIKSKEPHQKLWDSSDDESKSAIKIPGYKPEIRDSSISHRAPLVVIRPYVEVASSYTPQRITKQTASSDLTLLKNNKPPSNVAAVHRKNEDSSDDETKSSTHLPQYIPATAKSSIKTYDTTPKTIKPTVDMTVSFLNPPVTKPPPSTDAANATSNKFQQPDNIADLTEMVSSVIHHRKYPFKPRPISGSSLSSIQTYDIPAKSIKPADEATDSFPSTSITKPISSTVSTHVNSKKFQPEDYPELSSLVSSVVRNKKEDTDSSDDEMKSKSPTLVSLPKMDTETYKVPVISEKSSIVVADNPPDVAALVKEKINVQHVTGTSLPTSPPQLSTKQEPFTKEKFKKSEKFHPAKYVTMASIEKSATHNKDEESSDAETIKSLTDLLPSPCDSSSSSDSHEDITSIKPPIKETHFPIVAVIEEKADLQHSKGYGSSSDNKQVETDTAPISRIKRPGFSPPPPPPSTSPPPQQPVITSQAIPSTDPDKIAENGKTAKNPPETKASDSHSDSDEDDKEDVGVVEKVILRRAGGQRKDAFSLSRMTLASTNTEGHSLNSTRHSTFMGSMPELTCNRKSLTEVPVDESIQVRCSNPFCANIVPLEIARKTYKTCHSCAAFYCTRECRRSHWDRHKKQCMYGKVKLLLKQVLKKAVDDKAVHNELSRLARAGFLSFERGFVKLIFRNSDLALKFVQHGVKALEDFPIYVGWRDLIPQETGSDVYRTIIDLCQRYKPETRMVVLAAVCITKEIPVHAIPQWERQVVAQCSKLHLSKSVISNFKKGVREEPYMMVVNGSEALIRARGHGSALSPKKARKVCLEGIQDQLWERRVRLQTQHPDVYAKLKAYVDRDEPFEPITIYPRDGRTGRTFMCLITPDMSIASTSANTTQKSYGSDKSKDKTRL